MPSGENGLVQFEAGQTKVSMAALTDSGDHINFTSGAAAWSKRSGYAPEVFADGVATGLRVGVDNSAVNNIVDVTAGTCYLAGVLTSVNAGEATCVRGGDGDHDYIINSIVITSAGAIDVLTGTGHASAHNEVRNSAGGPPLITVGSIEIAQVRFTSDSAGVVLASEIFDAVGTHREKYDYPHLNINYLPGKDGSPAAGSVTADFAIPLDHVGPTAKPIYAEYYTPVFANSQDTENFVPPEESHSVSSKPVYGKALGSTSSSVSQGSFTFYGSDNVTDTLIALKNEILIYKFFPDENKAPYLLCQGKLGISRTFPAGDNMAAACTISALNAAVEVSG